MHAPARQLLRPFKHSHVNCTFFQKKIITNCFNFFSDQIELQQIGSKESIFEETKENGNQDLTDVAISETDK